MKRGISIVGTFLMLLLCNALVLASGHNPLLSHVNGFATQTPGGRDGEVIKVTNLKAKGPGSLREALETSGPRIIVFEVGGVIDLEKSSLAIREPYVTLAGQTAPSPGITIIRGGISIQTHDVIIQHICVRPGDAGEEKRSGWEPDGISTSAAYNVVVDHCSTTWAVDENLSVSGPRTEGPEATSHDVTISHCLIAEGLDDSTHAKGAHSKGTLIHDFCRNIAIIGNFYAHNVTRNPYFKAFTTGVVVNNLIYNPRNEAIKMSYVEREFEDASYSPEKGEIAAVGNVFRYGRNTKEEVALIQSKGRAYVQDNIALDREGELVAMTKGDVDILEGKPVWPEGFEALPADEVEEYVLKSVGARPYDRDPIDQRIIDDYKDGRGRIINSQDFVGGYPDYEPVYRELDVPSENVEEWLLTFTHEKTGI